jgi:hypothetical protein
MWLLILASLSLFAPLLKKVLRRLMASGKTTLA